MKRDYLSEEFVNAKWKDAGGRCECRRPVHNHYSCRCNKQLDPQKRGELQSQGGWEVHRITETGNGVTSFEVLCSECYLMIQNKH